MNLLTSGSTEEEEPKNELEEEVSKLEEELKASLALIENKKRELEAKKETLNKIKPITIRLRRFENGIVYLHVSAYRGDVIALLQKTPGRAYRAEENAIPVGELDNFMKTVKALPNITIMSNQGVAEAIHEYLYAPPYTVTITNRINIKLNRTATPSYFYEMPGYEYDRDRRIVHIPIGEAWRIQKIIEKFNIADQFQFDEGSHETVVKQIEGRLLLDKIATAEDVPDFPLIEGLKNVILRPFQKVGIQFFNLNGGNGICADEMGLGKTLQMIALAMLKGWRVLIVCPASLKINWLREISKFTDEKVFELQGETPSDYDMVYLIKQKPRFVVVNYDIIGGSVKIDKSHRDEYGYLHQKIETKLPWVEVLNLCNFDLCVYDEAHYIKNKDSQRSVAARQLKAKHIIGLTGTPILNRPGEFWPMLHILDPKTFPAHDTFVRQYTIDGRQAKNVDELRTLLKPLMIRRLKKDVVKELPPINRINDYHELTPKAKKLYEKVLAGIYTVLAEWDASRAGNQEAVANILVKIMRLKQIVAIDMIPSTVEKAKEINDSTNKKVLIFSQFKPVCYGINKLLGAESVGFVERTASGEFVTVDNTERQARVDIFQSNPEIKYFCVTEKTAKEGHNITAAEVVIFNDLFWTPAAHQQAEGRAYGRLSNLHPIDAYYRVGSNTIAEWIQQLLAEKMAIIEEVVEGVQKSRIGGDESVFMELIKNMKEGLWKRA